MTPTYSSLGVRTIARTYAVKSSEKPKAVESESDSDSQSLGFRSAEFDEIPFTSMAFVEPQSADRASDRFESIDLDSDSPESAELQFVESEQVDLDAVNKQIGYYDKVFSAVIAGFLFLPTLGVSLAVYKLHHAKLTREKIDASFAFAKEIINAPVTALTGSKSQLQAGGFIFTDIEYEDEERVTVKKATSESTRRSEMQRDGNNTADSLRASEWDIVLRELMTGPDRVIRIKGRLTIRDIQLRAANLIKAKAERDARLMFASRPPLNEELMEQNVKEIENVRVKRAAIAANKETRELLNDKIIAELIKIAGIYALAEALLKPNETSHKLRNDYVADYIAKNSDSFHALKAIFGFPQPDEAKHDAYKDKCAKLKSEFSESNLSKSLITTNELILKSLRQGITCCFNAFNPTD